MYLFRNLFSIAEQTGFSITRQTPEDRVSRYVAHMLPSHDKLMYRCSLNRYVILIEREYCLEKADITF